MFVIGSGPGLVADETSCPDCPQISLHTVGKPRSPRPTYSSRSNSSRSSPKCRSVAGSSYIGVSAIV